MVLDKWTTGDTITEIAANNRGIRKGTEAEIAAIPTASNAEGDITYNTTDGFVQVQKGSGATDFRGNLTCAPLVADETEVTVNGTTPTEKKVFALAINPAGFKGNQIAVVAEIKTDNPGTTANFRCRWDNDGTGPPAELVLTTTSTSYEIKSGTIDITGEALGRHTLNFYMDDGAGDNVSNRLLEVYGI
jgi:hypothetical protein